MNNSRSRAILSAAAVVALVVTFAACGDDSSGGANGGSVDTVAEPTSTPAPADIEHPTGADDVVLRVAYEGGFMPVEMAFLDLPTLLVTGDGRLIVQGPVIEIYPGPLLPNLQVRTISAAGIQELLRMAEGHGLLADVEYTRPDNIADASDTVVEITVAGATYTHRAYALDLDEQSDRPRAALAEFVQAATGEWLYGDNPELGDEQPYTSDTFLIRAFEAPEDLGDAAGVAPTRVDWPAAASVRLADALECAALPAAEVAELFTSANQLTLFVEQGIDYQLSVKPLLPGDGC